MAVPRLAQPQCASSRSSTCVAARKRRPLSPEQSATTPTCAIGPSRGCSRRARRKPGPTVPNLAQQPPQRAAAPFSTVCTRPRHGAVSACMQAREQPDQLKWSGHVPAPADRRLSGASVLFMLHGALACLAAVQPPHCDTGLNIASVTAGAKPERPSTARARPLWRQNVCLRVSARAAWPQWHPARCVGENHTSPHAGMLLGLPGAHNVKSNRQPALAKYIKTRRRVLKATN